MIVPNLEKYDFPRLCELGVERLQREQFIMGCAQEYLNGRCITSISIGKYAHTATCIERDGDFIYVYGTERDKKGILGMFTSIYHALDFVAAIQLNLSEFPLDWPAVNAKFDEIYKGAAD